MNSTFRIELKALEAQAATRPAGYLDAVMAKGTVNGPYLEIPVEEYANLVRRYGPKPNFPVYHAPSTESMQQKRAALTVTTSSKEPNVGKKFLQDMPPASQQYEGPVRGMGDIVAKVAQPIAKGLDKVLGTNIQGCGGCKKRQEKLNNAFPFNTGSKGP